MSKGKVYLIGAGPGDEGLMTVKGASLLEKADVVVYDRLVGENILARLPEHIEKINVGKNAGNHPVVQEEINKILLNKAQEGKVVVRLKGGDSFLFGRGGEELELLVENNIPFEVVPGITSAIAAAAYAGIPVTHRDFCSSLHIITGHAREDGKLSIDYQSLVKLNGTLVFMMSVSTIDEIAKGLITAGMDKTMPVGVIENGTRYNQRKLISTLENISADIIAHKIKSPAAIVVGKVCTLSEKFDWFEKKPLKGISVLITRPKNTQGKLSEKLLELGANVIECPCIKTSPMDFSLSHEDCKWIIFTSAVGVKVFFDKLYSEGLDVRNISDKKFAVVGTETATELFKYGIKADFVPTIFDGVHLAKELIASDKLDKNHKIAIYRAKLGSDDMLKIFTENKIDYKEISVYNTDYVKSENMENREFDYAMFTSASTVEGFVRAFSYELDLPTVKAICIGEQTAEKAREYGLNVIVSDKATITSMVEKLMEVAK